MEQDRDEWIRVRAHQIWEAEGQPHGRHDEHWHRATQDYETERGTPKEASPAVDDRGQAAGGASAPAPKTATGATPVAAAGTKPAVQAKP